MEVVNKLTSGNPHVHISNKDEVAKKIEKLVAGGKEQFQVISDFDMTLSRYHYNNKKCSSCHGVMESSPVITEELQKKFDELFKYYYPIEIDPSLSIEQKIPRMVEWWSKNHALLETTGITIQDISDSVAQSSSMFRDGHEVFFRQLHESEIPLMIFSAGIGDILLQIVKQKSKYYNNMNVIANFMKFDDKGKISGFESDIIHTFNKSEKARENSHKFSRGRSNVILMGDSMGDLKMADGLQSVDTCLKIAFLNTKIDEWLEEYKSQWDIVLTDDQTLKIPLEILSNIL